MTEPQLGLTMLVLMVAAIMIGFPTAFTLMALGVIFGYLGRGSAVFDIFVQRTFEPLLFHATAAASISLEYFFVAS